MLTRGCKERGKVVSVPTSVRYISMCQWGFLSLTVRRSHGDRAGTAIGNTTPSVCDATIYFNVLHTPLNFPALGACFIVILRDTIHLSLTGSG